MIHRKVKIYILMLIIILFCISITLFYSQKISPLQNNIKVGSAKLAEEKSLLPNTSKQSEVPNELYVSQTKSLQLQVPVSPSIETFLLEIEKAEVKSSCHIKNIVFVNDNEGHNNEQSDINSSNNRSSITSGNANQSELNGAQNNLAQNSTHTNESLPNGIEKKSINIVLEANDYTQFYRFIEEIESLKRITSIDAVQFTEDQLTTSNDGQEKQGLSFQLSLSIFYDPSLESLLKAAQPNMATPKPGNKLNPLEPTWNSIKDNGKNSQQTSVIPKEDTSIEENSKDLNIDTEPKKVLLHKVLPGETLFSISNMYYHSRDGETIIALYNDLKGITVFSGTILKIPIY